MNAKTAKKITEKALEVPEVVMAEVYIAIESRAQHGYNDAKLYEMCPSLKNYSLALRKQVEARLKEAGYELELSPSDAYWAVCW